MSNCSPWALLPLIYSVFTAAGLWLVYFLALNNDTIVPLDSQYGHDGQYGSPSYIGNAAYYPPASYIFSWVMNLSAFVGFILAVLRYHQLKHRINKPWMNFSSLVAFSGACFGMMMTGNVPFIFDYTIANYGSYLTFGLSLVVCWMQSYMTMKANLMNEGTIVGTVRFLLSASITVCMIFYFHLMFQDSNMEAARFQWALVMLVLTFFGTFAIEFRHDRFNIECTESSGLPEKIVL